ncbi:MAG: Polypeptide-transport-associated domain protein FtsQ-type [Bryobacterales bacterium]|nr:Polypeptide-transport-associated domain protein FtsQ-type [Bryobacterales bacterium]
MARGGEKKGIRWGLWLNLALACVAILIAYYTGRKVRHFVITDPRFTLASADDRNDGLSMEGLVHTSRARVLTSFMPDFGRSVFLIPIAERRRRLLAVDWVEDAAIARIWPNRVAVRIRERRPVAFVNLTIPGRAGSRVLMIDGEGVLLEQPPQSHFTFPVLSGISEQESEAERRYRVQAFLRLMNALGGVGKNISEVNAAAPENLTVVTQIDDRAVELVVGNRHFLRRVQSFLDHYPEIRRRSGDVRAFDLRLDDRITAGSREQ